MKGMNEGREMSFNDVSTRYMDVFGEEAMVVRPVGVKLIAKGKGVLEGPKEALKKGAERYITKKGDPSTQCNALARAIYKLTRDKYNRQ
jgi:hypothetical protein